MAEVVRLKKEEFAECIELMNTVFGRHNGHETNFYKELPTMCKLDEAHARKHFGIRADGRLVAALGVYPLPCEIAGQKLLFSTVGNVVTLPEYEGRGYMKLMMERAMRELDDLGADASRLGGLRQRYNRYGYEAAGTLYQFMIDVSNAKYCHKPGIALNFVPIAPDDTGSLAQAEKLQQSEGIVIDRRNGGDLLDFYDVASAWRSKPYLVRTCEGETVGYFSLNASGTGFNEIYAVSQEMLEHIVYSFVEHVGKTVTVPLSPFRREAVRYFSSVAGEEHVIFPSLFKVIHFDKVTDALMKLNLSCRPDLPEGEKVLEIENYGNIRLYRRGGEAGCEKTTAPAQVQLSYSEAIRTLYGPVPDRLPFDPFLSAHLPLPLSWSTLDRV